MPGGGFGIFDGCVSEWGTPANGWGAQYGGISTRSQCDDFPTALQAGCYFRFDWFEAADNPTVTFEQVTCPLALTSKSGCVRENDSISENPTGSAAVPTFTTNNWTGAGSTGTGSGSSTSSAPGSTGTGTVAQYGQCGGIGYTGPTTCASPYTCKYSSAYYSQCL